MKHINLHNREPAPAFDKEAEFREGLGLLQRAAALQPRSWPAHWLIGKAYQALDDHPRACEAFRQAEAAEDPGGTGRVGCPGTAGQPKARDQPAVAGCNAILAT